MEREHNEPGANGLLSCPAAERNGPPIEAVLGNLLPTSGRVLEVASGTGQHAVRFTRAFPGISWQATDGDPALVVVIRRRIEASGAANAAPPFVLDIAESWKEQAQAAGCDLRDIDAVVAVNVLHIAPWHVTEALFAGAAQVLSASGWVAVYGPFCRGADTAPSNLEFDAALRRENPGWGVRDVESVSETAEANGFRLRETFEMPANNLMLVFERHSNTV